MLLQFKNWPKKYFLEFNFPKKFRSGVTISFFSKRVTQNKKIKLKTEGFAYTTPSENILKYYARFSISKLPKNSNHLQKI